MLNHSDNTGADERPGLSRLLEQLARDSREWAEAEVSLAEVELAELKVQAMKAAGFAAVALAALVCAMLALTQAGIALLLPLLSGPVAALMMAVIMAFVAVVAISAARRAVAWRTESIFFRWLGIRPARGIGP